MSLWPHQWLFLQALKRPQKIQNNLLKQIIHEIARTKYGLLFNLHSYDNYAEFSKKIPIVSYEKLRHWIEKQKNHEGKILVSERVTRYEISEASKIFPYTKSLNKSFEHLFKIQKTRDSNYLEAPLFVRISKFPDLLPFISEVFFEFEDQNKHIKRIHELEVGTSYTLIISQKSGLYRYRMGLQVMTCSFFNQSPTFQVIS